VSIHPDVLIRTPVLAAPATARICPDVLVRIWAYELILVCVAPVAKVAIVEPGAVPPPKPTAWSLTSGELKYSDACAELLNGAAFKITFT
jgi:hypothetical protein